MPSDDASQHEGAPRSDPAGDPPEKVTFRPQRLRWVCWALAVSILVAFSVVATLLRGGTGGGGVFRVGDQLAMVGLGILGAAAVLVFTRPLVTADAHYIYVRNIIGSQRLPWAVVFSVEFTDRSPWVTLELADDDTLAVMAVQVTDGQYAVEAVRALRRLLAQSRIARGATEE